MREADFQKSLKDEISKKFPGCTILKNDPNSIQGIPDLLILFGKLWAMLEVKRSKSAKHRPNQDYYVDLLGKEGFAEFVYPENKDEVLEKLTKYFHES